MKNSPKPPWNLLYVGQLFLGIGPIWSVVDTPRDDSLEKINFPFLSRYQLQIASWLGVKLGVRFPFSVLRVCIV